MLFYILHLAGLASAYPVVNSSSRDIAVTEVALDVVFIAFIITLAVLVILPAVGATCFYCWRLYRQKSEEDLSREEDNQAYLELNLDEQELFFQSKEYLVANPYLRDNLTLSQNLSIQEKGIMAWEFVKNPMLTNNDLLILNKYELNFFKKYECSAQTNLPIPRANDVYYFESKIYSLPAPSETLISLGIGIKPYPWFRLPGRHAHSISYDSDGYRRHNQPFPFTNEAPFPQLIEGDVVGIGYRTRTGTVFFTRNGKKVSELKIGGHVKNFKIPHDGQLYPIIGANNVCSVHVNVGQLGYVFIEGNVKKWGFAPLEGNGPAPPAYKKFNGDILLERSEIDDENDLVDRENDFPPDFWEVHGRESGTTDQDKFSYNAYSDASYDERITMNSLVPHGPPSYDLEEHAGPSSDLAAGLQEEVDDQEDQEEQEEGLRSSEELLETDAAEDEPESVAEENSQKIDVSEEDSQDENSREVAGTPPDE